MTDARTRLDPRPLLLTALAIILLLPTTVLADQDSERLISAISDRDTELVAGLLAGGVSPESRYGKDSAMTWAAARGDLQSMRLIYSHGARLDPDAALAAATEGHLQALKLLLSWGLDAEISDPYGMSLLMTAALHGHSDLVRYLLEQGAVVSVREVVYGYTPLMLAAAHGHGEIVPMLIAGGADVNAKTDTGESALSWVSRRLNRGTAYREVAKILKQNGAQH